MSLVGMLLVCLVLNVMAQLPEPAETVPGEMMSRIAQQVDQYQRDLTNIACREKYRQIYRPYFEPMQIRDLEAEIVYVELPPDATCRMFRDVLKVNGSRVRDREQRLRELFLDSPASLAGVTAESARYNIGPVRRDFNFPTAALYLLEARNQPRISFKLGGAAVIDGYPVQIVEFKEQLSPTLIQYNGIDSPASGRCWVEAASGRVRQTELILRQEGVNALWVEYIVRYREDPALGMMAPGEMVELFFYGGSLEKLLFRIDRGNSERPEPPLEGRAVYDRYARFNVESESDISKPKQ